MSAVLSLTPKEVAALAGTTEKAVRNEIASGAVTPLATPRGRAVRRSFDDRAMFHFTLLRRMSLPVPAEDLPACERWTRTTRGGLRHCDLVTVDTAPVRAEIAHRLDLYRRGLAPIESRRDVLGGEPVFKGRRLSVRHAGGMAANGVPVQEIREDYPNLSEDDVAFAVLYARVKPNPGRPAKPLRPVVARAPAGA